MTATEKFVWKQLRDRGACYKFRRQHPVAGYVLDFYCPQALLGVEVDGEGHRSFGVVVDGAREAVLAELGILTLRFRNDEVALNWHACLVRIRSACMDRSSRPAEDE